MSTMVTILERCRISPPPNSVADASLGLTSFDMRWLNWSPLSRFLFFDFPHSKSYFLQTLVPNLKQSLSLVLQHYFPMAANLITPTTKSNTMPHIRYLNGDSVSLIFAESPGHEYIRLSGNEPRDVEELDLLIPQLPEATFNVDQDCTVAPVLAVQVTLFPDHGICFGFSNSHVVADGTCMVNFMQAFALIAKELLRRRDRSGEDNNDLVGCISSNLPFYDRNIIKGEKGLATSILWNQILEYKIRGPPRLIKNLVQATFFMCGADIKRLKDVASTKRPTLPHVSSFTVICAYVWTCMVKTRVAVGEKLKDENEVEHSILAMDCRARLDPPLPATYFGNCVTACVASPKTAQLAGEEGFLVAVEAIGNAIYRKLHNEEGVLKGDDNFFLDLALMREQRKFGVSGSTKVDYYGIDFGWGKPKKYEPVGEKFSLIKRKDSQADMEIGMCFPKNEMDVFTSIFAHGLIA